MRRAPKPLFEVALTTEEREYLIRWLRTQMTDEAEAILLKLEKD